MSSFAELLQQGASQAWLYFPSAILLGALHGLEPGHSKTMMAAFIVAIRGSVKQAVLLGLAATLSHTAVVWAVAMAGMYLGQHLDAETTEPYFQLASAAIIITIAVWMLWRTWRGEQMWRFEEGDDHHHHDETHRIDTGHGGGRAVDLRGRSPSALANEGLEWPCLACCRGEPADDSSRWTGPDV